MPRTGTHPVDRFDLAITLEEWRRARSAVAARPVVVLHQPHEAEVLA